MGGGELRIGGGFTFRMTLTAFTVGHGAQYDLEPMHSPRMRIACVGIPNTYSVQRAGCKDGGGGLVGTLGGEETNLKDYQNQEEERRGWPKKIWGLSLAPSVYFEKKDGSYFYRERGAEEIVLFTHREGKRRRKNDPQTGQKKNGVHSLFKEDPPRISRKLRTAD